jgi:hypothetical protein
MHPEELAKMLSLRSLAAAQGLVNDSLYLFCEFIRERLPEFAL